MAAPTPRAARARGGSPLIVLGVVLAIVTAILVLFLTSASSGVTLGGGTTVIVAAHPLDPGTVLSATNSAKPFQRVTDAFRVEKIAGDAAPADALTFTSQDDLNALLNNQMVTSRLLAGDILRKNDARLATLGSGPAASLANHDPAALQPGQVLFALHPSNDTGMQIGAQEGDHVDVLATACVQTAKSACQVAQTTLQNLLIYMVAPDKSTLYVVVSHQDALVLKLLVESAKIDLVLRKPGDTDLANTQPVDTTWIYNHFGFQPSN